MLSFFTKNSFSGGVHPPDCKELTEKKAIKEGPMPKELTLLLSQHIGAICEPLVSKNDLVKKGQLLAKSDAYVSAPVHSPVNGKVKDISLKPHPLLGRSKGITIQVAEDEILENIIPDEDFVNFDASQYKPEQICEAVGTAGIVGLGGAGFPTRVKIEPNPDMPKHTLIINGCECEPYITCDYRLMMEYINKVLAGIKLAEKATGASNVFIGIEDNKPKAIEMFRQTLENNPDCEHYKILPLRTKYPQGGERQLINAVLKKYVPTGGIPPMIGVCVLNIATSAAIAEAAKYSTPLTHRVVTVTGEAVAKPGNFYVPLGTPVQQLLDFCGGITQKSAKVLIGGPMMGTAIADLNTPITKTAGAITVLTSKQIGKAKHKGIQTQCIRCGRCLQVCPERINPTQIAHAVKYERLDLAEDYYMNACIECGCCTYVCPANIELKGLIQTGKVLKARQKKRMP